MTEVCTKLSVRAIFVAVDVCSVDLTVFHVFANRCYQDGLSFLGGAHREENYDRDGFA